MSMTLEAYEYWVGMDEWTRVQSSLLLVEIDPNEITQFVIKELGTYFERDTQVKWRDINGLNDMKIQEAWKVYQRFRTVEFGIKYAEDPYYNQASSMYRQAFHPYLFMREANIRNIPIPKNLMKAIDARYFRETRENFFATASNLKTNPAKKEKTGRSAEYDNVGKGLMAILIAKLSNRYHNGGTLSASQIKESVLDLAKSLGVPEFGLAAIERDITAGLHQLSVTHGINLSSLSIKNS